MVAASPKFEIEKKSRKIIQFLKDKYHDLSCDILAQKLNQTPEAIEIQMRRPYHFCNIRLISGKTTQRGKYFISKLLLENYPKIFELQLDFFPTQNR